MRHGRKDGAHAFYAGLLGLDVVPKSAQLAGRGGCWSRSGSVELHLGIEAGVTPARKAHPALVVDDPAHHAARLVQGYCTMRCEDPLNGSERGFEEDPFGNGIELVERARAQTSELAGRTAAQPLA